MYIDITGLDKRDIVLCLASYALRYLREIDPRRKEECGSRLEALEAYEGPVSIVGYLPFLPDDNAPWIDLRGKRLETSLFDEMFGENAGAGVIRVMREVQKKKAQAEEEKSEASTSDTATTATQRHGTPGSRLPPRKRYRVECPLRASEPGPSTSAEAGSSVGAPTHTGPTSARKRLLASLSCAMECSKGLPDIQAGIDRCMAMAMQAPTTSTSAEAGSSTGTPPDKRYRVEYALRASEPGPSTADSSGGGDEGPSTSLEKAGCSHGPHMAEGTGHHRD